MKSTIQAGRPQARAISHQATSVPVAQPLLASVAKAQLGMARAMVREDVQENSTTSDVVSMGSGPGAAGALPKQGVA